MNNTLTSRELSSVKPGIRLKPWQTILLFGMLLFVLEFLGAFWVEKYSGGCMFIIPAYFYALAVILPVLLLKRFGVAMAVYLPNAIIGFPFDYYYEWVQKRALLGPWAVVLWCLVFVGYGLSVDLAYKLLPARMSERWRAILTGVVLGAATFGLTLLGLTQLYANPTNDGHLLFFTQGMLFSLSWLIISSAFGGYTAYAIARKT